MKFSHVSFDSRVSFGHVQGTHFTVGKDIKSAEVKGAFVVLTSKLDKQAYVPLAKLDYGWPADKEEA